MTEKPALPPLPPLSIQALHDLHEIEDVVAEAVKDLDHFLPSIGTILHSHNNPKRIVRTKQLNLPKPKLELASQKETPPIEVQVQQCVAVQLRTLRMECNWSVERLAEVAGFNVRTVARHLSGEVNPHLRNISAYERVFSKHLKRQVVIDKMP